MAIQLAVAKGATVIATASPAPPRVPRRAGRHPGGLRTRPDRPGNRQAAPDGVDVALDLVGTEEAIDVSLELVLNRARIVTIAAGGRARQVGIKAVGGGPGADPGTEIRSVAQGSSWQAWPGMANCGFSSTRRSRWPRRPTRTV